MMRPTVLPLVVILALLGPAAAVPRPEEKAPNTPGAGDGLAFDQLFVDQTLRLDLYHHGDGHSERLTVDRWLRTDVWAGSRTDLVDESRVGTYLVEMHAGKELIFATSYESIYSEYRATAAARDGRWRTFHESVLMPRPRQPVSVRVSARRPGGPATELLRVDLDPDDPLLASEPAPQDALVVPAHANGPPHETLDVVVLGEGYTDRGRFERDLERVSRELLAHAPFSRYADRISIVGVVRLAAEPGCDEPTHGVWRDSPLGLSFNSLGSPRYLLSHDPRAVRDVASVVPYDTLLIMVDHERYGGGGIYNQYCTFTAGNRWSTYLMLHEMGHSFGGLADEYYTSAVAFADLYPAGFEPPEANITALLDPERLKWHDLVAEDTPIPTPWSKAEFDARDLRWQAERRRLRSAVAEAVRARRPEAEVRFLRRKLEERAVERTNAARDRLASEPHAGRVGAFEGAGYATTGLYRPSIDCLMFTRGVQPFCPVCEREVERRIRRTVPVDVR